MILVTTQNILDLIQKANNSDLEKAMFAEKVKASIKIEQEQVENGLMLIFDDTDHVVLNGLTFNDLLGKKYVNMNIAYRGIELIKHFEGIYLNAYLDIAGIATIGRGTIRYPNGKAVKIGDNCTIEQADEYLMYEIAEKETHVRRLTEGVTLNQGQYDALVSFVYNLGQGSLGRSLLLRKVKANPNDPTIASEFMRWNKAAGKVAEGLTRRRKSEAHLYRTGKLLFFEKD